MSTDPEASHENRTLPTGRAFHPIAAPGLLVRKLFPAAVETGAILCQNPVEPLRKVQLV
jgi:hypothetical protein